MKEITMKKIESEISKTFMSAYCLPIPEIQLNGGTKTFYTITGIGHHENRKMFDTRKKAWADAYCRIYKLHK